MKKKQKNKILRPKIRFEVLTIFPHMMDSYIKESILKRAQNAGLISIASHDIRAYSNDRHKKVDDSPFGGGPGMVIKVEPVLGAVTSIKRQAGKKRKVRVILFSTRGKKFDAREARRLSQYDELILICGRYEGVDERVAEYIADEEISMGDYVLSGGELPAMIVIDAVSRFIPGVLGKTESLEELKGSYPVYTKPAQFKPTKKGRSWDVPKVLLSGDHKKIERFRKPLL